MSEVEVNYDNVDSSNYKVIGRKSWVAYVGDIATYIFFFAIIFIVDQIFDIDNTFTIPIFAFFLIFFVFSFMTTRSYKVFYNDEGVWLTYGFLPWARGGNGIRWRDMDMAFYQTNFVSWITNSYTISVKHKYTNETDFMVRNIWDGKDVCGVIHNLHTQYLNNE
jgi:hypothetical protein